MNLVFNVILISFISCSFPSESPELCIEFGCLRGFHSTVTSHPDQQNITLLPRTFLGIPYALPPIKQLRFQRPVPWKDQFDGPRDAVRFGHQCWQLFTWPLLDFSEDCLFMNLYLPSIEKRNHFKALNKTFPIMIWIYGGAFSFGNAGTGNKNSNHLYDGADAVYNEDVIVVNFNYRVGPFGFLYNDTFPSNNGLHDIRTAIQYVHRQAKYFDGDVDKITVFGLSSGAYTTAMLMLDLDMIPIHRVIIMSSPSVTPLTNPDDASLTYQKFTNAVGCNVELHFDCLQKLPAWKLVYGASQSGNEVLETLLRHPLLWLPVIDTQYSITMGKSIDIVDLLSSKKDKPLIHFQNQITNELVSEKCNSLEYCLTVSKQELLRERLSKMQIMLGVSRDEGLVSFFVAIYEVLGYFPGGIFFFFRDSNITIFDYFHGVLSHTKLITTDPIIREITDDKPLTFTQLQYIHVLSIVFKQNVQQLKKIIELYPGTDNIRENVKLIVHILSMVLFICPNLYFASKLNGLVEKVYMYEFTQEPGWMPIFKPGGPYHSGKVAHAAELAYFWNRYPKVPTSEQPMARLFQDLFTSFARGQSKFGVPEWIPYDNVNRSYLNIGTPINGATVNHGLFGDECSFWNEIKFSETVQRYP